MAETLTVTYDTTTGRCTYSGLTAVMPNAMRRLLTRLGIEFKADASDGHLLDKQGFNAAKRGRIVQRFNNKLNTGNANLIYSTDNNVTLTLTSV